MIHLQQVHATKEVTTSVNRKLKLLFQSWEGVVMLNDFRPASDATVTYFKRYKCKYYITDARFLAPLLPDDLEYAANNLKRMKTNGMECYVCIEPHNWLTVFRLEELARKLEGIVKVFVAKTIDEAISFILTWTMDDEKQLSLF